MKTETMKGIIDNVYEDLNDGDEITFAFQGGEPTLIGLDWFKEFTEHAASKQKNVTVHYALQTNGLLIDDAWGEFLNKNKFLVGLSIDANARLHDKNRLDANGKGTFSSCLRSKALLEQHKVEYNILCVLTNELAGESDKVWRFILNENIKFIQFIPCLEGLDEKGESPFALRPARFAAFYSRLYYWWMKELENNLYISVKFFDDTANYFFRGSPPPAVSTAAATRNMLWKRTAAYTPAIFMCWIIIIPAILPSIPCVSFLTPKGCRPFCWNRVPYQSSAFPAPTLKCAAGAANG
jgi:uncharacterized protein